MQVLRRFIKWSMQQKMFCCLRIKKNCMLCLHSVLISFLLKYPIKTLKGHHTDVSDSLVKTSKRRLHEKHYLISRSKFWLMSSRFWWKMCLLYGFKLCPTIQTHWSRYQSLFNSKITKDSLKPKQVCIYFSS